MPPSNALPVADATMLLPARRFGDDRGYFEETFNAKRFAEIIGEDIVFVQDNESLSRSSGTVRGLHYQRSPFAQGKLIRVVAGALVDVVVDIRPSSPTYLKHVKFELDARTGDQLWVPPGMAHGFCTTEPNTLIHYKVTDFYNPDADRSLYWQDRRLRISWPVTEAEAVLSAKDEAALSIAEMEAEGG